MALQTKSELLIVLDSNNKQLFLHKITPQNVTDTLDGKTSVEEGFPVYILSGSELKAQKLNDSEFKVVSTGEILRLKSE